MGDSANHATPGAGAGRPDRIVLVPAEALMVGGQTPSTRSRVATNAGVHARNAGYGHGRPTRNVPGCRVEVSHGEDPAFDRGRCAGSDRLQPMDAVRGVPSLHGGRRTPR